MSEYIITESPVNQQPIYPETGICSGCDVIFMSSLCSTSNTAIRKVKWGVQSTVEIGRLLTVQQQDPNELFRAA